MDPVRVLHITETLDAAGIETFLMNLYNGVDCSQVQFDFLTLRNRKEFYEELIANRGGNKFSINANQTNTIVKVISENIGIAKFLKENKYDIVHFHFTTPLRAIHLIPPYRYGAKIRIYHSHTANVIGKSRLKMVVYSLLKKIISKYANNYFACSVPAAEWMFERSIVKNNEYTVVHNGIDTEKFKFSQEARESIRKELGITSEKVIIHVGRFSKEKNHIFLVEIFRRLVEIDSDYRLVLIGDGTLFAEIAGIIDTYHLKDYVFMLGVRNNIGDYLSAADCFVMPSLFEGLPVSVIEAQCNGLPCVLSASIPREVKLCEDVMFLETTCSDEWINTIMSLNFDTKYRIEKKDIVREKGYDIIDVAKKLQMFYLEKSSRKFYENK